MTMSRSAGAVHGVLENIRDHRGIHNPLYTVRFDLSEVSTCRDQDSIWVNVHEEWLTRLELEERNCELWCSWHCMIASWPPEGS